MGVFDSVLVPCPDCGRPYEMQSQSGPGECECYALEEAPFDVLGQCLYDAVLCADCKVAFRPALPPGIKAFVTRVPRLRVGRWVSSGPFSSEWCTAFEGSAAECMSWFDLTLVAADTGGTVRYESDRDREQAKREKRQRKAWRKRVAEERARDLLALGIDEAALPHAGRENPVQWEKCVRDEVARAALALELEREPPSPIALRLIELCGGRRDREAAGRVPMTAFGLRHWEARRSSDPVVPHTPVHAAVRDVSFAEFLVCHLPQFDEDWGTLGAKPLADTPVARLARKWSPLFGGHPIFVFLSSLSVTDDGLVLLGRLPVARLREHARQATGSSRTG